MACRHHQSQMPQSRSSADLGPPLPTDGAVGATGIDRSCLLSEQRIGEHEEMRKRKTGEGWKGLRSSVLDDFLEKIDPSKRRGKHEETRKGKGKRGERKRGEGWKGQDLPIPFSFSIDVGHKLHRGSDELRSNVLDGFLEKIDPSKRRGKHKEMRERKGKRGERKRGEGCKGQGLSNPFSFSIEVGHKFYRGSLEPRSNVLFPEKIDPSKEKEKHQKLNYLRKPEKTESSTSSSVEEVKRVLGNLFMKATAEERKVLQNVFDSGPGSNSWMAAFKNEIDKQERSLKAN